MTGEEAINGFLAGLGKLSRDFAAQVAKEAEMPVAEVLRRNAAAATDSYGEAWPLRKDGSKAMPNAPQRVWVDASGPTLKLKVKSKGAAIQGNLRADRRRRILPDGDKGLSRDIIAALQEGAARAFQKAMGGR